MTKQTRLVLGLATLLPMAGAQAIVVTPTTDANTLTGSILGSGITLVGAPVYSQNGGSTVAAGTFTGAGAAIGIESGLILTTGAAASAAGPNNFDNTSGAGNLTSLTFSFTSTGGDLFFNYVFASEEYNEFTNTGFNDFFRFELDGVNIALIPGTTTPVSINTVNGGNPLGSGASNPGLFNNNDLNDGGPFFDIEYDGFTDVFTAQALGLSAGTHTIRLVIGDVGDSSWDSAVFIQGGSFSDTPTDPNGVPDGGSVTLVAAGALLLASRFMRRRE